VKDEAFELGRQWSRMYAPNSPTRKLIEEIMDTYFLVNIVHNDFKDPDAVFRPFFVDEFPNVNQITNGSAEALANGPHSLVNGVRTAVTSPL
jgi:methylenetetrahydrofolate reductase (NADPH)